MVFRIYESKSSNGKKFKDYFLEKNNINPNFCTREYITLSSSEKSNKMTVVPIDTFHMRDNAIKRVEFDPETFRRGDSKITHLDIEFDCSDEKDSEKFADNLYHYINGQLGNHYDRGTIAIGNGKSLVPIFLNLNKSTVNLFFVMDYITQSIPNIVIDREAVLKW